MARDTTGGIGDYLDLASCESQSTLSLYLADTSVIHIATEEVSVVATSITYTDDLRKISETKQTFGSTPDRCIAQIQNVDKVFGASIENEDLVNAVAVVGRYYSDGTNHHWEEMFRGEAFPILLTESECQLEILHDLVAAGFCVSDWTLAENCQVPFKGPVCRYSGIETTCNKKRRSKLGCLGRANEFAFVGMEFPDTQAASAPEGDDGSGGVHQNCPHVDDYVLARAHWTHQPRPKRVGSLVMSDELFDPLAGVFRTIKELVRVLNEPLWRVITLNGAIGLSSHSHPIIPYAEHITGEKVKDTFAGDPILTFSSLQLQSSKLFESQARNERGDVMRIELDEGHVYCWSSKPAGPYIVCHNSIYKDY